MLLNKRIKEKTAPIDTFPPADVSPFEDAPGLEKKQPWFRLLFGKKEPSLDLTLLEAGATTIQDILSPNSVDLTGSSFVIVDGVYHAYLYITGYRPLPVRHRLRRPDGRADQRGPQ